MNIKRLMSVLLSFILIFSLWIPCHAFNEREHNQYMNDVLFKNFKDVHFDKVHQPDIQALGFASYLTIDQFNGSGAHALAALHEYGVENIPSDINEISYTASGRTHRSYTHRGWNYHYVGVASRLWPVRKNILLSTANRMFDFKGNLKQQDSFCQLVYYIHILGDHLAEKSYTTDNGLMMAIGGRHDKEDIIHEILRILPNLFPKQVHSHKYRSLTGALERYNNLLKKLEYSKGGINSQEKFVQKQTYTQKIMDLLTMYLPEMLKDEQFFYNTFYANN